MRTGSSCGHIRRSNTGTSHSRAVVVVNSIRHSKQYIARKELQKQAKQEYLRRIHEAADKVESDHLVFQLQPSTPRARAELQQSDQQAALNQQLAQQIPQLDSWQQLQQFIQQHGPSLNFLNVLALVMRAAAIHTQVSTSTTVPQLLPDPNLLTQLSVLVLDQASWFQPAHFAAAAAALSALGVQDAAMWDNLTAAAEHKVAAFTFQQLAVMLEALAVAGFTPELVWVERTYRQAAKHLHAADPADVAVLMWAWGKMGYTPRDRLLMNQVKVMTRRAFDRNAMSAQSLVQLMHGLARMPKYAPNQGWLAALARAVQPHLDSLAAGVVVDLLLSLVALGFIPPEPWMDAALSRLQDAMLATINHICSSCSNQQQVPQLTAPNQQQQHEQTELLQQVQMLQEVQQQQQLLFLPPVDLQQLLPEQLAPISPGLLLTPAAAVAAGRDIIQEQWQQAVAPGLQELDQLRQLFEAAAAAEHSQDRSIQQQQELQQHQDALEQQPQQSPATQHVQLVPADASASEQEQQQAASISSSSRALPQHLAEQQQQQQLLLLTIEHLAVICWCFGRLQFQASPEWMHLMGQLLLLLGPRASSDVLVDVLLGCAATGYLPAGPLQHLLLSWTLQHINGMQAECLRRLCQALSAYEAGLEEHKQQQAAWAGSFAPNRQLGPSSAASDAAAAAAGADVVSSSLESYRQHFKLQLAAAIEHRQGIILLSSSTAQLSDVLAFIAAADQVPSLDYMATAVTRAVQKLPDSCPTPAICTLLWALARMGFKPHPQLLHHLLAALQKGLHLLSSQDLADAGWALCTLKHRPGSTWLSLYLKEVAAKAAYMQPQALTDTLWALACFAATPSREWLKQVVVAVGSKVAAGSLSRRNAAVVLWALQQLGFQPLMAAGAVVGAGAGAAGVDGSDIGAPSSVDAAVLGLVQVVQQA